jgi:protein-tyrosine-phosphatase
MTPQRYNIMTPQFKIVTVCKASNSRSVVAGCIFRDELRKLGRSDVTVQAAGFFVNHPGQKPLAGIREVLDSLKIDYSEHRRAAITLDLIAESTVTFAVDTDCLKALHNLAPQFKEKIRPLIEGYDVPDSKWRKDPANYIATVVDPIRKRVPGLLQEIFWEPKQITL